MQLRVHKSPQLAGQVYPPGSKSHSIRALMVALMARGDSKLTNLPDSDDIRVARAVCAALGVQIQIGDQQWVIQSTGCANLQASSVFSGNSGITTRFVLPILGLRSNATTSIELDCGPQMRARPIQSLVDALCDLGMHVVYSKVDGQLPLQIAGQLSGGETSVTGMTSQFISALLLALPCAPHDSIITVQNLYERPYMEMTLYWLREQGIRYHHSRDGILDRFTIPGGQEYHAFDCHIPADFSSASYPLAAGAICKGSVTVSGLDMQDSQGDKRLIPLLQMMGANITETNNGILILGGAPLHGIAIDANDIPDLLPTLAVLGTVAQGKTEIRNVKQARIKETDRIHSMSEGLKKMGAKIDVHEDGLTVYSSCLHGASVHGYEDHRTVMALALAGMRADGETVISDADAIAKTYPNFVEDMQKLGAQMAVVQ